jgi:hypothetical protein
MTTIYSDDIFLKCTLYTVDGTKKVIATLGDPISGRFTPDLLRQDGTGVLIGRLVEPPTIPDWLKPGTILKMNNSEQQFQATLTYQPIAQTKIKGLVNILGSKVRFTYIITTEFKDV